MRIERATCPADDAPREHIDDEGDVDKTSSRRDVGKVCYPQLIGTTRLELALDQIERSFSTRLSNGCATLTTTHSTERDRLKELKRENRELKRANEILRKASAFFAQAELDRRPK